MSQLSEMKQTCFTLGSRLVFVPLHHIVNLDEDLVGTRAKDQQVKTLSLRKAQNEAHMADVIEYLFPIA